MLISSRRNIFHRYALCVDAPHSHLPFCNVFLFFSISQNKNINTTRAQGVRMGLWASNTSCTMPPILSSSSGRHHSNAQQINSAKHGTYLRRAKRSLAKSQCWELSTSTMPHGYCLARTLRPLTMISSSHPIRAKGRSERSSLFSSTVSSSSSSGS
jgi:hypothetical protein